jgi:hypothetical protein
VSVTSPRQLLADEARSAVGGEPIEMQELSGRSTSSLASSAAFTPPIVPSVPVLSSSTSSSVSGSGGSGVSAATTTSAAAAFEVDTLTLPAGIRWPLFASARNPPESLSHCLFRSACNCTDGRARAAVQVKYLNAGGKVFVNGKLISNYQCAPTVRKHVSRAFFL